MVRTEISRLGTNVKIRESETRRHVSSGTEIRTHLRDLSRACGYDRVVITHHEAWNDTVESAVLVAKSLGVKCEMFEVLGGFRNVFTEEAEDHSTDGLSTDGHVEEYMVRNGRGRLSAGGEEETGEHGREENKSHGELRWQGSRLRAQAIGVESDRARLVNRIVEEPINPFSRIATEGRYLAISSATWIID
ncbi:cyclophilin [Gracilaria domingensis]|nr:cyclophilin [Gracilaria domingensis]